MVGERGGFRVLPADKDMVIMIIQSRRGRRGRVYHVNIAEKGFRIWEGKRY
jgi:hypothetical protein